MIVVGHFKLITHDIYKECAIASRDLPTGSVVIEEVPAFVINYARDLDDSNLVPALAYKRKRGHMTLSRPAKDSLALAQNLGTAVKLQSTFYTPDTSDGSILKSTAYKAALRGLKELQRRRDLFPEIHAVEESTLVNYNLLVAANAHAFTEDSVACLEAGCKVTHTCFNPNVAVSMRPLANRDDKNRAAITMKHIALRDIQEGEILFGSYAKLTNLTIRERQQYLMNHKMFSCKCSYCCSTKDMTRGLKCLACCDEKLESSSIVPPLSTMYQMDSSNKSAPWKCQNCHHEVTGANIFCNEKESPEQMEARLRRRLDRLLTSEINPSQQFQEAQTILAEVLEITGWRHCLAAASAEAVLSTACRVIDSASSASNDEIEQALHFFETLPIVLEKWYSHLGISAIEELSSLYLQISEQLMTLSALHHNIIPRSMEIVQTLLLKVRPLIEERRSWPISHVLQEYYDELLVTLDNLVNGVPNEDDMQAEETVKA